MPPVYVSQQGARVQTRNGRLLVTYQDQTLLDRPLEEVDQLTVVGRGVQVTTPAIAVLVGRGVEVAYLSRSGRFLGKIVGALGGGVQLRAAQYRAAADPAVRLRMAGLIVRAKLQNQVLLLAHWNLPVAAAQVEQRMAQIEGAATLDQLRGIEGAAAAAYFRGVGSLLPGELGFRGRAQHPPPDPVNAVLSFGYTLVLNEAIGQLNVVGLDAYAGFLHSDDPSRPSLALDMEEEFRPLADDVALRAFREGLLRRADFAVEEGRLRMTAEARKRYLLAYEEQMQRRVTHELARGRITVRHALELQMRQLGRLVQGEGGSFEPVRLAEIWERR